MVGKIVQFGQMHWYTLPETNCEFTPEHLWQRKMNFWRIFRGELFQGVSTVYLIYNICLYINYVYVYICEYLHIHYMWCNSEYPFHGFPPAALAHSWKEYGVDLEICIIKCMRCDFLSISGFNGSSFWVNPGNFFRGNCRLQIFVEEVDLSPALQRKFQPWQNLTLLWPTELEIQVPFFFRGNFDSIPHHIGWLSRIQKHKIDGVLRRPSV